MKCRKVLLFGIGIFSFLLFSNASAATCDNVQCITCTYEVLGYDIKFEVSANGSGGATVTRNASKLNPNNRVAYQFNDPTKNAIVSSNFISSSSKKLICPSVLYYLPPSNVGTTGAFPVEISFSIFSNSKASSKLKNSSDNKKSFFSTTSNAGKSCHYTGKMTTGSGSVSVTITKEGNELKYELGNGFKVGNVDLEVDDFPTTATGNCPQIYVTCGNNGGNKFCSFSKNAGYVDEVRGDEGQIGENVPSYDDIEEETEKNNATASKLEYNLEIPGYCSNAQVARTLKFIGILLFIAKIFVPALIILMGSVDFAQAMLSGKSDEIPKRLPILIKRFIAGLIIFFIPTIMDFMFSVLDGYSESINRYSDCRTCILNPGSCNIGD